VVVCCACSSDSLGSTEMGKFLHWQVVFQERLLHFVCLFVCLLVSFSLLDSSIFSMLVMYYFEISVVFLMFEYIFGN